MTDDEWELKDIPRRLAYEQSRFGCQSPIVPWGDATCLTVDQDARREFARLLIRAMELQYNIRRCRILDRWAMRRYPAFPQPKARTLPRRPDPLTPMLIDEAIEDHQIKDFGAVC